MKISSIPKSGREDSIVYVNTRHGKVVREYVRPSNPRTADQQGHRHNVRAVSGR
jgi:phosphoribosylamine-glycine ligase